MERVDPMFAVTQALNTVVEVVETDVEVPRVPPRRFKAEPCGAQDARL